MSESFNIELGNELPLSLTLPSVVGSWLFPRARIYDSSDVEVAGSPFDLSEVVSTARYTSASFTPLVVGTFTAHFVVFSDGGHTIEARRFNPDQDSYIVELTVADAVWDEPNTGADHNVQNSTGKQQRQASGGFESRDVASATANTVTLNAAESAIDDFLTHRHIAIVDGLGAGQIRVIDDYDGTTKVATVSRPWSTTPDATSDYLLLLSAESEPLRAVETEATAGSSTTEIRTGLTQADDFFNNMQVVILNTAGTVVRNIDDYANINGAITVSTLPFTPAVGDPVYILRRTGSVPIDVAAISTQVWSEALPGAFGAGEAGERLASTDDTVGTNLDVVVSTRSDFDETADPVELLDTGGAVGTSASELVDDIWDEPVSGHQTAGTTGRNVTSIAAEDAATAGSTATEIRTGLTQADDFFNNMQVVVINAAGTAVRNIDDFANINGAITVTTLPFTPAISDPVLILRRTGSVPVDAAAISTAVWSEALPGAFGANEAGERLATTDDTVGTNLDVVVSTRSTFDETTDPVELLDAGGAAGTSASELVDDMWDEGIVGHSGAGSAGLELQNKAEPGDAMDLVADAVDATSVATDAIDADAIATDAIGSSELATSAVNEIRDSILSDSTAFPGANIDATISSRSTFDETTDPVELLDTGGAAGTSADELVDDMWDESKTGHTTANSMGQQLQHTKQIVHADLDLGAGGVGIVDDPIGGGNPPTAIVTRMDAIGAHEAHLQFTADFIRPTVGTWSNKVFIGGGPGTVGFDPNGLDFAGTRFENLSFQSTAGNGFGPLVAGFDMQFRRCFFLGPLDLQALSAYQCQFATSSAGPMSLDTAGDYFFHDCSAFRADGLAQPLFLDFDGGGQVRAIFTNYEGRVIIRNMTNATHRLEIDGRGLDITIDASCTDGDVKISGWGEPIVNNQSGTLVLDQDGYNVGAIGQVSLDITVAAGSTASEVRTAQLQADDFYNNMTMIILNAAGTVSRRIGQYTLLNGAFIPTEPFPFTPTTGDQLLILTDVFGDLGGR